MRDIAREAAELREALRLGLRSVRDVIEWSDSIIAKSDKPSMALIDLSSMWNANRPDVVSALNSISRDVPAADVVPSVLTLVYRRLVADPGYGMEFAREMYRLAVEHGYPLEPLWFDDAFDLAEQGVCGTVENVREELLEYVKRTIERESEKPSE
jgi:hypothetical protein